MIVEDLHQAAVASVLPDVLIRKHLRQVDGDLYFGDRVFALEGKNIYVIGAGKAAYGMALTVEAILGPLIHDGLITTKYGHGGSLQTIQVLEAGHPLPDAAGQNAVHQTLNLLKKVKSNDIVICLISGGASAIWCDPAPTISLEDFRKTSELLINCGATIHEINAVRKHISSLKGGQLARLVNQASLLTLMISDVPGDDPDVIASGPTVPDLSTFDMALETINKYDLTQDMPGAVMQRLQDGQLGLIPETPKPGDKAFDHVQHIIIGSNKMALEEAASFLSERGIEVFKKEEIIKGDGEKEAIDLVQRALEISGNKKQAICLLQGGETTVVHDGSGYGGRNQHFVLSALYHLLQNKKPEDKHIYQIFSFGTDGSDGPTDANGAFASTAQNHEMDQILHYLKDFNSYHYFHTFGGLLISGPTQTNVMDIMGIIILPQ